MAHWIKEKYTFARFDYNQIQEGNHAGIFSLPKAFWNFWAINVPGTMLFNLNGLFLEVHKICNLELFVFWNFLEDELGKILPDGTFFTKVL